MVDIALIGLTFSRARRLAFSFSRFVLAPSTWPFLTGLFALLTGTLPVPNMHFDQCSCGSLPTLPIQPTKGPPHPGPIRGYPT